MAGPGPAITGLKRANTTADCPEGDLTSGPAKARMGSGNHIFAAADGHSKRLAHHFGSDLLDFGV